jgi:hypothetical protein
MDPKIHIEQIENVKYFLTTTFKSIAAARTFRFCKLKKSNTHNQIWNNMVLIYLNKNWLL